MHVKLLPLIILHFVDFFSIAQIHAFLRLFMGILTLNPVECVLIDTLVWEK